MLPGAQEAVDPQAQQERQVLPEKPESLVPRELPDLLEQEE